MPTLSAELAKSWIHRWDAQQERYVADREERFAVIGDVVQGAIAELPAGPRTVLDLGCGPGSLSARLAELLPEARIIGVDADPLLLGLGRAHYGARVEFLEADLGDDRWPGGVPGAIDAVVSTTALHWLAPTVLRALYQRLGELLRPGGVYVNGDHFPSEPPELSTLTQLVGARRAERAGVTNNEEWAAWWAAAQADANLGPLITSRSGRAVAHGGSNLLTVTEHAKLLRAAGFRAVGTVWQAGEDNVLVALR